MDETARLMAAIDRGISAALDEQMIPGDLGDVEATYTPPDDTPDERDVIRSQWPLARRGRAHV